MRLPLAHLPFAHQAHSRPEVRGGVPRQVLIAVLSLELLAKGVRGVRHEARSEVRLVDDSRGRRGARGGRRRGSRRRRSLVVGVVVPEGTRGRLGLGDVAGRAARGWKFHDVRRGLSPGLPNDRLASLRVLGSEGGRVLADGAHGFPALFPVRHGRGRAGAAARRGIRRGVQRGVLQVLAPAPQFGDFLPRRLQRRREVRRLLAALVVVQPENLRLAPRDVALPREPVRSPRRLLLPLGGGVHLVSEPLVLILRPRQLRCERDLLSLGRVHLRVEILDRSLQRREPVGLLRHLRRHARDGRLRRAQLALGVGGLSLGLGAGVLEGLASLPEFANLRVPRLKLRRHLAELLLNLAGLGFGVRDAALGGLLPALARGEVRLEPANLFAKRADVGDVVEIFPGRTRRRRPRGRRG
mmetsp:Transcript_10351/g.46743  ORF Transcript_10351/g.46743 Transcript_10351/m.46743 type:complete len:412 (+) Transcript_10351:948-2183(+)